MLRFIVDIIKDLLCQADISIHLMLRFIQMFLLSVQLFQPFQYISCYGLSASVLQSQTLYHDFNTSHVTVYRQIRAAPFGMWIFQYISCYGLSRYQDTVNSILELFQYISCYGLSSPSWDTLISLRRFQYISCYGLSSVLVCKICDFFLFQYISCYGLSFFWSHSQKACRYFNTSHVTVYHLPEKLTAIHF